MRQFQTESDAAIPTLRLRAVAEITATLVLLLAALFGISKPLMKSARKGYRRGLGAGGRGRFVVLTAIVTLVAATVGGVAIWILYDTGLAEQRARLAETARSQAHMIEAMARFDRTYANYPAGTVSAVITQFRDAHEPVASLGFGIVVKIDLSEVRMPFIEAGGIVAGLAVLVIIIGTGFFLAVSNPIINEMHQTARRLQQAQQIGRMGDWSWDVASGKIHWSDEIYRIFGRQSGEFEPTYESFTATLHEADVERIRNSEEAAFAKGEKHSIDLGQLTGGIAHDFNNLLGIIIGNLEIMKRIAKGDEKILGRVETALKGARRGAELTKSLLGISRQDAGSTKAVSLNDLITEMREIIAKSLTGKIEVQTYLAGDLDLLDILTRLRMKGFGLSIDDFGTGYSSLSQLQNVPFTELKIDGSFVMRSGIDKETRAIVESTVDLGKRLDMTVVAEGVETQENWDLLEELGCDEAQGYFMGRPMPGGDLETWMKTWE